MQLIGSTVESMGYSGNKFTRSIGTALASMTFNSRYRSQRNIELNKYSNNSTQGVIQGLKMAGKGIWDGITGIIYDPYRGAKKHGVTGFAKVLK